MLLNSLVMALDIAFGKIVISIIAAYAIVYLMRNDTDGYIMNHTAQSPHLLVAPDSAVYQQLQHLVRTQRWVFFAGLPGTGKSLLMHQLAHLASAAGRTVHLLQWDVARPVFETSPAGQCYPVVNGVTHSVIRQAVGLWARQALVQWQRQYPAAGHLLIGETPFIGHRFIELARRGDDDAEPLLGDTSSLFVVPVPSRDVRGYIETMRQSRSTSPVHDQEREDAPPQVLQTLWQELYDTAPRLGIQTPAAVQDTPVPYDPELYQQVYQALLRHRHQRVIALDTVLPVCDFSPYRFTAEKRDLVPTPEEVTTYVQQVAHHYPNLQALQQYIDQWYCV